MNTYRVAQVPAPNGTFEIVEREVPRPGPRHVRIAVGDADNAPPIALPPNRAGLGGLGLHLVESIATSWGHQTDSHGKVVWADIACEPVTPR